MSSLKTIASSVCSMSVVGTLAAKPCGLRRPRTRAGKVLRSTIRKMADGQEWRIPATIDDETVLDDFREVLAGMGRTASAATDA